MNLVRIRVFRSMFVVACGLSSMMALAQCPQIGIDDVRYKPITDSTFFITATWPQSSSPQCKDSTESNLTGFAIDSEPGGIVTALHGVLCAIGDGGGTVKITASKANYASLVSTLRVTKVDVENDLAFLSSDDLPKLAGICTAREAIHSDTLLHSFGFTSSVHDTLNQHCGYPQAPMSRPLAGPAILMSNLASRHSPEAERQFLFLQFPFSPGDSGSPVIDLQGCVVGMADGTFYPRLKDQQWAIPLSPVAGGVVPTSKVRWTPVSNKGIADRIKKIKELPPPAALIAYMKEDKCSSDSVTRECLVESLRRYDGGDGKGEITRRDDKNGLVYYQWYLWPDLPDPVLALIDSVEFELPGIGKTLGQKLMRRNVNLVDNVDDHWYAHWKGESCVDENSQMTIAFKDGSSVKVPFKMCEILTAEKPSWIPEQQ